MRNFFTSVRITTYQTSQEMTSVDGDVKKKESSFNDNGNINWLNVFGKTPRRLIKSQNATWWQLRD